MRLFTYSSDENQEFDEKHGIDTIELKIKELIGENYSDEDVIEYILSYDNILQEDEAGFMIFIKRVLQNNRSKYEAGTKDN